MEKIICDICGTDYPETENQCPICGCAKGEGATTSAGNASAEEQTYAYVKGGRFSKSNVRRRLNSDQQPKRTAPAIVPDDDEEEEEEQPQSNRGLIIVVIVLLLAIIAVSTYIAVMFFGKAGPTDPTVPGQSSSSSVTKVPCASIALDSVQITLTEKGETKQIGYTLIPANTTDRPVFTVEDPAVVSVDSTGKITALSSGTTTIFIVCGDVQSKLTVVCSTTEPTTPPTTPVDKPTLPQNSNFTVPADATPVEAYKIIVTNSYVNIRKGPSTSYDKAGTANKDDQLTVIATYYADDLDWGLTEKGWLALKYTKRSDGSSAIPGGDTLKLNRSDFTLDKNNTKWNLYSGALDPTQITWTSGNTNVVTVKDGVVTAVGNGSTEITAEYNGQMVTCKVYVNGF